MEYSGLGTPYKTDLLSLYNCDCMELLRQTPDKYYSLCIVDPPWGKGISNYNRPNMKTASFSKDKQWDNDIPSKEYFNELFRVSKNQIIWGFNWFIKHLYPSNGFIYWHKHQNGNFAEGELAWCNNGIGRFFDRPYQQDLYNKIHPTQKPVALYKWLLQNYAKQGDKILDTHGGSMSIAIACHQMGFDLTLCELDKDYYEAGIKRVKQETAQRDLFL